ncbi:hypothetical protein RchiOBHm_Chr2g0098841 [Rosa chinensis]|uniref:Uncharacterized protein n=1 Tax=Rosa chinensis TaxID=74649 RepID=A0A2P6RLP5_ROSCH|nr:hypothetical protein RchiOBHm_Chr2g0098841 [Rosa chinensis]
MKQPLYCQKAYSFFQGSNDLAINYYSTPPRSGHYDTPAYQISCLNQLQISFRYYSTNISTVQLI